MPNQKTTRPPQPLPWWAGNVNLVDPGKSWDGTPTKVEPGAGKRALGWNPDEKPAAQHLSQLLAELGQWAQYIGDAQMMNWEMIKFPTAFEARCLGFCEGLDAIPGAWIVGGLDRKIMKSWDEVEWLDINPAKGDAAADLDWVCTKPMTDSPAINGCFMVGAQNSADVWANKAGTYTEITLAGTAPRTYHCAWAGTAQRFVIAGFHNTNIPSFWRVDVSGTPTATQVVPTKITSTNVDMIACNGLNLLAGLGASAGGDKFVSTDGGATWTTSAHGFGSAPTSITYNSDTGLFMVVTGTNVLTSSDGVNWSTILTWPGNGMLPNMTRTLVGVGSFYAGLGDTDRYIAYTTDGGALWRAVQLPARGPHKDEVTGWGLIVLDGAGGATISDSHNVASVAITNGATGYVTVTLKRAMSSSTDYVAEATDATQNSSTLRFARATNRTSTTFRIYWYNSAGTILDPSTASGAIQFNLFGKAGDQGLDDVSYRALAYSRQRGRFAAIMKRLIADNDYAGFFVRSIAFGTPAFNANNSTFAVPQL